MLIYKNHKIFITFFVKHNEQILFVQFALITFFHNQGKFFC
jgi:hypothetical protein